MLRNYPHVTAGETEGQGLPTTGPVPLLPLMTFCPNQMVEGGAGQAHTGATFQPPLGVFPECPAQSSGPHQHRLSWARAQLLPG